MIDIHTHILPFIDDGSPSDSISINMLEECAKQGITDIILTPHYRNAFKLTPSETEKAFQKFNKKVLEQNLPINLYLGQEIFVEKDYKKVFKENKILTLNNTKFVLIEFDYFTDQDIVEVVYELKRKGFISIVAHIERYVSADLEVALEVKNLGGYIQVNAESIVGETKRFYKKFIKKLFKNGLVDFVSSDIHYDRMNYMSQARRYVEKKFGKQTAEDVFINNAKMIIEG